MQRQDYYNVQRTRVTEDRLKVKQQEEGQQLRKQPDVSKSMKSFSKEDNYTTDERNPVELAAQRRSRQQFYEDQILHKTLVEKKIEYHTKQKMDQEKKILWKQPKMLDKSKAILGGNTSPASKSNGFVKYQSGVLSARRPSAAKYIYNS